MRKPPSLRAQAISLLAQREYSERELRTKLLRRRQATQRQALAGPAGRQSTSEPDPPNREVSSGLQRPPDSECEIDDVIGWLLQCGYLDEQRFVASRVLARAERFGVLRIEQELSRHGLALPSAAAETLRTTELERAQAVWQRRFGSPPADMREAARQARFLSGRGFSGEIIRRVVPRWRTENGTDGEPS